MALRIENGERAFEERVRHGEIAGEPFSRAIQAKRDGGLEGNRPRFDFAQNKLCNFTHWRQFAAHIVTHPQAVVTGELLQRIIDTASQLACMTKSRLCFRRLHAARLEQRVGETCLQCQPPLTRRSSVFHFVSFSKRSELSLRLFDLGKFRRRRKAFERGREDGVGVGGAAGRLIEIGKRQRRAQFEALGLLLLRDGDSGEERFFDWRGVCRIAL